MHERFLKTTKGGSVRRFLAFMMAFLVIFTSVVNANVLTAQAATPSDGNTVTIDGITYSLSGGNATVTNYNGAGGAVTIPATIEVEVEVEVNEGGSDDSTSLTGSIQGLFEPMVVHAQELDEVPAPESNDSNDSNSGDDSQIDSGNNDTNDEGDVNETNANDSNADEGNNDDLNTDVNTDNANDANDTNDANDAGDANQTGGTTTTTETVTYNVTAIAAGAFAGNSSITSISIPSSITSIGSGAFANCENLATVNIAGSPSIADDAFTGTPYNGDANDESGETPQTRGGGAKGPQNDPVTHTVTFIMDDADNYWNDVVQEVADGEDATAPDPAPEQAGYRFNGWNKEFTNVTEDLEVEPTWVRVITVKFLDHEGNEIAKQKVDRNGYPEAGVEAPDVPGKEFTGWQYAGGTVDDYTTVKITKTTNFIATYTDASYSVKYYQPDGVTLIKEEADTYAYNSAYAVNCTEYTIPEGTTFTGWMVNGDANNIVQNGGEITITGETFLQASYTGQTFTVTFRADEDPNWTPVEIEVAYGEDAELPEATPGNYPGHAFKEWGNGYTHVTSNVTVNATWNTDVHTVTFTNGEDESDLGSVEVAYGEKIPANSVELPEYDDKEFASWRLNGQNIGTDYTNVTVTEDIELIARFATKKFTVKFILSDADNYESDGSEDLEEEVEYGGTAEVPEEEPERDGYEFGGYTEDGTTIADLTNITANKTVHILWTKYYKVTFKDKDGEVLATKSVQKDSCVTDVVTAPTIKGKTFIGWTYGVYDAFTEDYTEIPITKNTVFTATYDDDKVTVTFVAPEDLSWEPVERTIVYGATADIPDDEPVRDGYTFAGWEETYKDVEENTTSKALWTPIKHTITFVNNETTETFATVQVDHDAKLTEEDVTAPAVEGKTFSHWKLEDGTEIASDELYDLVITANQTITAYYDDAVYTVKFYNTGLDGNPVFKTMQVTHGNTIGQSLEEGQTLTAPAVEGYHFIVWSYDETEQIDEEAGILDLVITKDMDIYAGYEIDTFTVTFKVANADNYDDDYVATVNYGEDAEAPAEEPVRANYRFDGYEGDYTNVTSDLTITVNWTRLYTVTFLKEDGTQIGDMQSVEANSYAAAGVEAPNVSGKEFKGWKYADDQDPVMDYTTVQITADTTFKATYEQIVFDVKFFEQDGTQISNTQQINSGAEFTVTAGYQAPEGYDFIGWARNNDQEDLVEDGTEVTITADTTFTATYRIKTYDVTFINGDIAEGEDGHVIGTVKVEHGASIPQNAVAAPAATEGREFDKWTDETGNEIENYSALAITSNRTITATYKVKVLKVTFMLEDCDNYDENVVQKVNYGQSATAPDPEPAMEGRVFGGYNEDFSEITEDMTVTVNWVRTYKVTFKELDGSVITTQKVIKGQTAKAGVTAATLEGKTFKGWSYSIGSDKTTVTDYTSVVIQKNLVFIAAYDDIEYNVTYYEKNGTTMIGNTVKVPYGQVYTVSATPQSISGQSFTGWTVNGNAGNVVKNGAQLVLTGDTTFTAKYTTNQYTVTFVAPEDPNWAPVSVEVAWGQDATIPSAVPANYTGHTFDKWSSNYKNITADTRVTALWTTNKYKVTFVNSEIAEGETGRVFETLDIAYGDTIPTGTVIAPAVTGKSFSSWQLKNGTEITDFANFPIRDNVTIYATYKVKILTVTFDLDDTDNYAEDVIVKVPYGQAATAPKYDPEKAGYRFNKYNEDFSEVVEDMTVTVDWIKIYTVTFYRADGTLLATQTVDKNGYAKSGVTAPTIAGKTFKSWKYRGGTTDDYTTVKITKNTKFTAVYEDTPSNDNNNDSNNDSSNNTNNTSGTHTIPTRNASGTPDTATAVSLPVRTVGLASTSASDDTAGHNYADATPTNSGTVKYYDETGKVVDTFKIVKINDQVGIEYYDLAVKNVEQAFYAQDGRFIIFKNGLLQAVDSEEGTITTIARNIKSVTFDDYNLAETTTNDHGAVLPMKRTTVKVQVGTKTGTYKQKLTTVTYKKHKYKNVDVAGISGENHLIYATYDGKIYAVNGTTSTLVQELDDDDYVKQAEYNKAGQINKLITSKGKTIKVNNL